MGTSAPAPLLQATTFGAAEVCLELATVVGSLAPLACAAGLLRRSGLVVVVGGSAMATAVLLSTVLQSSVYWSCVPLCVFLIELLLFLVSFLPVMTATASIAAVSHAEGASLITQT
jgi:hypothetical protein